MTYSAKYEIGETIWAMIQNRAEQHPVAAIEISHSLGRDGKVKNPRINYSVNVGNDKLNCFVQVPEDLTADTKEQLLARL